MPSRNNLKARLWGHGRRAMTKGSSPLVPLALGGGLIGGLSAGGASMLGNNPYANPKGDMLRGAGLGALGVTGAYGLSRLPPWAVLPSTLAIGAGLYGLNQRRSPTMHPPGG